MRTNGLIREAGAILNYLRLPKGAKLARRCDRNLGLGADPGILVSINAALAWLCNAQDNSTTRDGGVSRHFSLVSGWGPSYPETTGYIVPTFLENTSEFVGDELTSRARRMLDWLLRIQLPCGGFQGGTISSSPIVPVTFNTGQILLGLASGVTHFGEVYKNALHRAAGWLADTQDPDGCWRRHGTPFAESGEKTYETHVSWGLFEAARATGCEDYGQAGLRNSDWALTNQQPNGWFSNCCLTDPDRPLTHTLGYALRGIVEAFRYSNEERYLAAALRMAKGLQACQQNDGSLPGRLDSTWQGTVPWVCLTGVVQIAHSWMLLYQHVQDSSLLDSALRANLYVRKTLILDGEPWICGGIKGSFPIDGAYGAYEFLNWAAKFFIDSNRLEQQIRCGLGL